MEGLKSVTEFLNSDYEVSAIYATSNIVRNLPKLNYILNIFEVSETDLLKISTLKTPQQIVAVVKIPIFSGKADDCTGFEIFLDGIQDPGNLGTIIRTADWFGIKRIVCSEDTVEAYNPKVVQATMGSLSRYQILYTDLKKAIQESKKQVFGAVLNGKNLYNYQLPENGILLLGNEGNGISEKMMSFINTPVSIPGSGKAESLNVAISCAVFCSEITRNSLK